MDDIITLLGAKFCHDIASPLNALGLILEILDTNDQKNLLFAKQSKTSLVNCLNFYRLLFSYHKSETLFEKAIQWIKQECRNKKIVLQIELETRQQEDWLGKIVLCAFSILCDGVKEGGELCIYKDFNSLNFEFCLSGYKANERHFAVMNDTAAEVEDSMIAIPLLLKNLAKNNQYQLQAKIKNNGALITLQ